VTIDARFIPSQQLGGDCFDYYWLDPDYLVIYLLDVSGHGLGAALLSISLLNVLRSQALPGVNFYQPNNVLAALNDTFQMSDQNEKYFTIWYGVYNRVKHQLVYASAGHPPAILISRTSPETLQVQRLKTPSLPIGMFPDIKFSNERCNITALSALYIFSDGIYEFNQVDGTPWSLDEFADLVAQNWETATLDHMLHQIQGLNARSTFDDDLSLLRVNFS
jgi:sigma-B regulation protein RsbU (phosphoserine phosphatase)